MKGEGQANQISKQTPKQIERGGQGRCWNPAPDQSADRQPGGCLEPKKQLDHRHMFTQWSLDLNELAERAVFQQPATYFTDAALQEHGRNLDFPSRKLRRRPTPADLAAFRTKKADLQRNAAVQEQLNPASFSLENSWTETIQDDKAFYHKNTILRTA